MKLYTDGVEVTMDIYKEGNRYSLFQNSYHSILLLCTYVEQGTAYFIDNHTKINYKKNLKNNKLYIFNQAYQTWDTVKEPALRLHSENSNHSPHVLSFNKFYGD